MAVYVYPTLDPFISNRTRVIQAKMPIIQECGGDLLTDPCCSFNMTKCGTDRDYYQPVFAPDIHSCLNFPGHIGITNPDNPLEQLSSYVKYGDIGDFQNNNFTVEVDIIPRFPQEFGTGYICGRAAIHGPTVDSYWALSISSDNQVQFQYLNNITNEWTFYRTVTCGLTQGVKTNIKFTRVGTSYTFYLDDVEVQTIKINAPFVPYVTTDNPTIDVPGGTFVLGIRTLLDSDAFPFNGLICGVKLTNNNLVETYCEFKQLRGAHISPIVGMAGNLVNFPTDYSNVWIQYHEVAQDGCTECGTTDLLYFQFQIPDNFNDWVNGNVTHGWSADQAGKWLATVDIMSPYCCSANFNEYAVKYFCGMTIDGVNIQQIVIDPTLLPPIFYLKFTFNVGHCRTLSFYTEPYQKISCEQTMLIEGEYSSIGRGSKDCLGYYYGDVRYSDYPSFRHINQYRIPGSIEHDAVLIERKEIHNIKTLTTATVSNTDTYRLRTDPIPPYVFERLRTLLLAKNMFVNDETFLFAGDLNKDNETGRMWIIDTKIKKAGKCLTIDYTCSS